MFRRTDIRRAIVVVLDGLRPDAIDAFELVHLRRLAQLGASSLRGRTVSPSLTWPALASLLTGAAPHAHGVISESVHLPRPTTKLCPLPQLLLRAGYHTSAFMGQLPPVYRMVGGRIAEGLGFSQTRFTGRSAAEVLQNAGPTLRAQREGLIFMHWADADRAGHAHGWMSPEYGGAARRLDGTMGALMADLCIASDPATLLIALADHGGGGIVPDHHDGEHPLNATIPMFFAGASVARRPLADASLLDVPATIAWALGVQPPSSYAGRVLRTVFVEVEEDAVA
jgi:predicted AlkP superfamily pyrophosphatase or phosphodiesterase